MPRVIFNAILLVFILLWTKESCSQLDTTGMVRTRSGIYYRIHSGHSLLKPKLGDHLIVDIVKSNEKGEILFDTRALDNISGVEIVLEDPKYNGDITEVFFLMNEGSRAELYVLRDSVDREFLSNADRGKYYVYDVTLRSFKSDQVYQKDLFKHNARQLRSDHKSLCKAMRKENFIKTEKISKGLMISWISEHSGPKVEIGDTINVHYIGTLLNGKQFDSSRDRGETFEFVFNERNVIEGWAALLPHAKLGDRIKLFIASKYAYGRNGAGRDIGPDEPLIFDVEILSVR